MVNSDNKGCWIRRTFLLVFSISIMLSLPARSGFQGREFIYGRSNLYVTAFPTFYPNPEISSFNNPYGFAFRPKGIAGFTFEFTYMYNFNRHWGISTGLQPAGINFQSFAFEYRLRDEVTDFFTLVPDYHCLTCHSVINHVTAIPVNMIFRTKIAPRIDLALEAGLSLKINRSFYYEWNDAYYSVSGDSSFHTIQVLFEDTNQKRRALLPNIVFSAGINHLLKNNHYINYQLSLDIPTINPYTNGTFVIMPGTIYESGGTFRMSPLSIGLAVNYVFSFKNKKNRTVYLYETKETEAVVE